MKKVIEILAKKSQTISIMESCTGGAVANAITNIEGASSILKFSAVTYSNEFKIKMGVSPDVIDKYSVYSIETAREMSKNICDFANSNYGIGITGNLKSISDNSTLKNEVFTNIYDKDKNTSYDLIMTLPFQNREKNKELIVEAIVQKLLTII